jgi:hypothetical protein
MTCGSKHQGASMSKRQEQSNKFAQRVCRELRHIIATDGIVDDRNFSKLSQHFNSWMRNTGKIKYKRPKVRHTSE